MAELILEPTPQAQWQALVHEAQSACDRHLDETLENYLVFLLMRFADKPHCTARIMAADYLNSQTLPGEQRADTNHQYEEKGAALHNAQGRIECEGVARVVEFDDKEAAAAAE